MWIVLETTIDSTTTQDHCYLLHLKHRLTIETRRWTIIPISRDTRLCRFCSFNVVENEAHFVLECPLYNPIRDQFPSLFENIVPGSLKFFFQLDQQVDVSLYLAEATALHHSKKSIGSKPFKCTFNPISLFEFSDFRINVIPFHFHELKLDESTSDKFYYYPLSRCCGTKPQKLTVYSPQGFGQLNKTQGPPCFDLQDLTANQAIHLLLCVVYLSSVWASHVEALKKE